MPQKSDPPQPPTPHPTPKSRQPSYHPTSDQPTSPEQTHTVEIERVFIADQTGIDTVVFHTGETLSQANIEWLKYGVIDRKSASGDGGTIARDRGQEEVMMVGLPTRIVDLSLASGSTADGEDEGQVEQQGERPVEVIDLSLDEDDGREPAMPPTPRATPSKSREKRRRDEADSSGREGGGKNTGGKRKKMDAGPWTIEQQKAMFREQLIHGEGRDWGAVVQAVNAADVSRPRTQRECMEQWQIDRRQIFE